MSHDIIADTMNEIMNAKRIGRMKVSVDRHSKLLVRIMEIAKERDYIEDYSVNGKKLEIKIGKLNQCGAIKPRFNVKNKGYLKYVKRYLPARDVGIIIVSTNNGLMTHDEADNKSIGGCLIAYFY